MPFRHVPTAIVLIACVPGAQTAEKPNIPVNYDEGQAGTYTLPDPLTFPNAAKVRNAKDWYEKRRPQILKLFEENMHGYSPGRRAAMKFDVFEKADLHSRAKPFAGRSQSCLQVTPRVQRRICCCICPRQRNPVFRCC